MKTVAFEKTIKVGQAQLRYILGDFRSVTSFLFHLKQRYGQVVLPCTLHDLARVNEDPQIAAVYSKVDYCTTDGMPLVLWFHLKTKKSIERVYGPDILNAVFNEHMDQKQIILCPSQESFTRLEQKFNTPIKKKKLQLLLLGKSTDDKERKRVATDIKKFSPHFVWIGIGSPNQVSLAVYLRDNLKLPITYFCVGAAVSFLAGTMIQAPVWIQRSGLEWLFRLVIEPARLWKRYVVTNPLFLVKQMFRS